MAIMINTPKRGVSVKPLFLQTLKKQTMLIKVSLFISIFMNILFILYKF